MFNLNSNNHGSYKNNEGSRKRTSPEKEINYVRALDKNGNPILINKEDLAQVVGELIGTTTIEKRGCYLRIYSRYILIL